MKYSSYGARTYRLCPRSSMSSLLLQGNFGTLYYKVQVSQQSAAVHYNYEHVIYKFTRKLLWSGIIYFISLHPSRCLQFNLVYATPSFPGAGMLVFDLKSNRASWVSVGSRKPVRRVHQLARFLLHCSSQEHIWAWPPWLWPNHPIHSCIPGKALIFSLVSEWSLIMLRYLSRCECSIRYYVFLYGNKKYGEGHFLEDIYLFSQCFKLGLFLLCWFRWLLPGNVSTLISYVGTEPLR